MGDYVRFELMREAGRFRFVGLILARLYDQLDTLYTLIRYYVLGYSYVYVYYVRLLPAASQNHVAFENHTMPCLIRFIWNRKVPIPMSII